VHCRIQLRIVTCFEPAVLAVLHPSESVAALLLGTLGATVMGSCHNRWVILPLVKGIGIQEACEREQILP
jgi:hypothetical protein